MRILCSALNQLLESGDALTSSAFTIKQRQALEKFASSTRLVTISKQGRSILYQILNRDRVFDYLRAQQPLSDDQLAATIPVRSKNIGKQRSSKKGQTSHDFYYLLMKAWDLSVIWQNGKHEMFPAIQTTQYGVGVLKIATGNQWHTGHSLWLVENQALFDRCDWLPENFNGSLAYYAGQLPDVLIQWLAVKKRSPEIILFPDYDGIGLANYVRLANSVHPESELRFYWMPDWEDKLSAFGNSELWQKTRIQFENAYKQLQVMGELNDDFEKLARLSQVNGKALEQEVIWLKNQTDYDIKV